MDGIARSVQNFSGAFEGIIRGSGEAGSVKRTIVPGRFEGDAPANPNPQHEMLSNNEEYAKRQAARAQEAAMHEAEMNNAMKLVRGEAATENAPPPTASDRLWGAMKVVQGFTARTYKETQNTTYSGIRSASTSRDLKLFLEDFGELVRSGRTALLSSHEGSIISEGEVIPVDLFVSTTHLCISGRFIVAAVPLKDIVSMRPSVKLTTNIVTPYFLDLPDPRVKADALLIYTNDERKSCYQVFDFTFSVRLAAANVAIEKAPLELFYESLYCAWEKAKQGADVIPPPQAASSQPQQQQQAPPPVATDFEDVDPAVKQE